MRIRNIRPGFWTNEDLADCTDRQNLLFIGLWMLADKNGCVEYRPRRIKAQLFGIRDYTAKELQKDCGRLSEVLLIHFYRASEGETPTEECNEETADFIYIPNFVKHQRLTSWEKNDSEDSCPLPKHFRSTAEELHPEVAEYTEKLKDEESEVAEEVKEAATTADLLRRFQQAHPSCAKIGQAAFDAAIMAATTTEGMPDVEEAVAAFERDMPGAQLKFPMRELKKYLNHSSRKQHDQKSQKKKKATRRHPSLG